MPTGPLRKIKTELEYTTAALAEVDSFSRYVSLEPDAIEDLSLAAQALNQAQLELKANESFAELSQFFLAVIQVRMMAEDLLAICRDQIRCSA